MKFTHNTDTIDIDAKSLGVSNDARLDNRGLHIQIRHNKDKAQFALAVEISNVIVDALNKHFAGKEVKS